MSITARWSLVAVGFLSLASSAALGSDYTFRGLKFGVDVREQLPECERDERLGSYKYPGQPRTCWERPPGCVSGHGSDCDRAAEVVFVDSGVLPGGMGVRNIDGKLAALMIGFYTKEFPTIEAAFRTKYGKPAASEDVPWQSTVGAKTVSHRREWHYGNLRLFLVSPAGSIDHGFMKVATPAYLEAERQHRTDAAKKAASDL